MIDRIKQTSDVQQFDETIIIDPCDASRAIRVTESVAELGRLIVGVSYTGEPDVSFIADRPPIDDFMLNKPA